MKMNDKGAREKQAFQGEIKNIIALNHVSIH